MAQPNVAREPSMEEILASIRRIIESNDPASDAAGLQGASGIYADEDQGEVEAVGFTPELVANDAGLPPQPERRFVPEPVAYAPEPDPVAPAERSLSLADVAARVRAASARHQEIAMQRPAPRMEPSSPVEPRAPEPVATAHVSSEPAYKEPAFSAPIASLPMPELRPSFAREEEASRPTPVVEAVSMVKDEYSKPETEKSVAIEAPQPAEPQPLPVKTQQSSSLDAFSALISDEAGAQVAKSFGELADVFDGLDRRSVEDIAQDMLRPMLQEWLDDNLPTLVERLVREEIERVARGPRR